MTTRNGLIGMAVATAFAALPFAAFAAPPTVTITEGPGEGGTITEESVTFAFDTTEASTTRCSITGADDDESFFSCGSPQTYELPDGEYRFVVEVSNDDGTETDERTFTVAIEEEDSGGGGGDSEEESDSTPRVSSGGGIVRYQTPIYPDRPKIVMRPGTFAIVPSAENPYVSLASVTPVPQPQVAGAQTTTQPRTTATAPRSTVAQAPRTTTTTTTTTPAPTTTPTTTPATSTATSAPFGVATTVPAGAALGAFDGGVPNWVWAALVAIVVLGIAGYAWSTTREV